MASAPLSAALRHVHRLFDDGAVAGLPDGRLLDRFVARRDEAAFAALVERHSALVFAVCRRSLDDPGETDDAFQATFLVLARRAGSVRNRESLGGWLYAVARRVCLLANRASARRRRHEKRAAEERGGPDVTATATQPDDLGPALFEEIDRLPESLRLPVVLCLVEGRSRAEAAERLRWTEAQVRGRLFRARARLRDRLVRRGLAPAAALSATSAARPVNAGVPKGLVERATRAALGASAGAGASGAAVTLCDGVLRSMLAARLATAAAVALTLSAGAAAVLVASTLGGPTPSPTPERPEPPPRVAPAAPKPKPADAPKAEGRPVTASGRVVGPDGAPVPGAVVTVARFRLAGIGPYGWDADREGLARAVADKDGRFRLDFDGLDAGSPQAPDSPDRWERQLIVASAEGFGPAWASVEPGEAAPAVTLTLARDDVPVRGRLVDLEGRPVGGATVGVHLLYQSEGPDAIDRWLETLKAGKTSADDRPRSHYFPIANMRALPASEPSLPKPVVTDVDGLFVIRGLGRDRLAELEVSGPSVAFRRVQVVTRTMERVEGRPMNDPGVLDSTYHGAEARIVAQPARPVEGTVRDAKTGEPIPGATVTAETLGGSTLSIEGLINAITDARGRYRLLGLPGRDGHRLNVYPPLDRPYFVTEVVTGAAGPGVGPLSLDVALKPGVWVAGRVTDARTGAPVQAAVQFYPYLDNPHARGFPNFDPNRLSFDWTGARHRTDAEGRFRVLAVPGRGVLAAKSFDRSYRSGVGADALPEKPSKQAMRSEALPTYNQIHPGEFQAVAAVDVPDGGPGEFRRDLKLEPSPSLTVRVVDPEGQPVADATARGRFPERVGPVDHPADLKVGAGGLTTIIGLVPGVPRVVVFEHEARALGALLVVNGEDAPAGGERTVTLRPLAAVAGRVVDAEGRPVQGVADVRVVGPDGKPFGNRPIKPAQFGDDGRFRVGLPAGGTYALSAVPRPTAAGEAGFEPFELAKGLAPEPGKAVDLGTFDASTGKRVGAAAGKAADVPILGRVIDLEGRPVAGVSVRAVRQTKPKAGDLSGWIEAVKGGAPPWVAYGNHLDDDAIPEGARREATTDADGRFRLDGLGAERVVDLTLRGDSVALAEITVVTRELSPVAATGYPSTHDSGTQTVFGASFTFAARAGRPVEGVVRDAATRKPLAGVGVQSYRFAGSDFADVRNLKTTTDANGRFRLVGLPKGQGNVIIAVPDDGEPYLMQEVRVADPAGLGPVTADVDLHRGLLIVGKVTDLSTGEPVAGARLHYLPFRDNPFVRKFPEFEGGNVHGFQDRYQTGPDGTFRLVVLPGRAIVGVDHGHKHYRAGVGADAIAGMNDRGMFETYSNPIEPGRGWPLAMKEIDPAEGAETVALDLGLDPGATVRLRAVDAGGKVVEGASGEGKALPGGLIELANLAPDEERIAVVRHEGRKLGKAVRVRPKDGAEGPVDVTLEPLATFVGRVVDPEGDPVPGATVRPDFKDHGFFLKNLGQVVAGKDGRFRVEGVPTGAGYSLFVETGATIAKRRYASADADARPGETTDVGDVRLPRD